MPSPPPAPLSYQSSPTASPLSRALTSRLPTVLAPLSLLPTLLFIIMLFTSDHWSRWFQTGQRWERITGITWLWILFLTVVWIALFLPRPKRALTWICLILHLLFLVLSIFPGFVLLAWLMHWLHGPGA